MSLKDLDQMRDRVIENMGLLEELKQTLIEMFSDAMIEADCFQNFDEVFELDTSKPFTNIGRYNLFLKGGSVVLQDASREEVIDWIDLWIDGYNS